MALKQYLLSPASLLLTILPLLVLSSDLGTMELAQVFGQQMTPRYSPRDLYGRQTQDPVDLCGVKYVLCDPMHCCRSGQTCELEKLTWYCTETTDIGKGLAIGAIVGIVIALLIVLIAIGLAIFCCCRIKRRRRAAAAATAVPASLAMNPVPPAQPYVPPQQASGYYPPVEGYQTSPYQPYPQQQQGVYDPVYPVQSPAPQYGVLNQPSPYEQQRGVENKGYFAAPTPSPVPQGKEYAVGDVQGTTTTGGVPTMPAPVQAVQQNGESGQAMYEIDSSRR